MIKNFYIQRLCDHTVWLDHGVARMQGDAETIYAAYMEEMSGEG